jgi:uncharacterized membrane protein YhaH (DUF805 family)
MNHNKITIGRSTNCTIVLADLSVSRIHAELERLDNGVLLLTDCDSRQGTFVVHGGHAEKVKQKIVSPGDLLRFGSLEISVDEILQSTGLAEVQGFVPAPVHEPFNEAPEKPFVKIPREIAHQEPQNSLWFLFFSFDGRIARSTYWLKYMLPYFLSYLALVLVDLATHSFDFDTGYGTYSGLFALLSFIPALAMGVKRCHDRNRSGWFLLISVIPLVNFWVLIELWFLKGTTGVNQFGPDPLG